MSGIVSSYEELIGQTPILQADRFAAAAGIPAGVRILAKLEMFNPSSSVKDRAASAIINAAIESGALTEGGTIIEATSGNMGIGLASVAASRGFKMVACMPETMSVERQKIMKQLGVELVLTPGSEGMKGAIARAEEIAAERPNSVVAHQFENRANVEAHIASTGPEIYAATEGTIDFFVAGVGTGGTLMGTSQFLKEKNPGVRAVAVEPQESAVISGEAVGKHGIQGIGAGFIPGIVDTQAIDEIVQVQTAEAIAASKLFSASQGLLVGISAGAALAAVQKLVEKHQLTEATLVVILPDTGERYLSTPLFAE